jgi:hypothetical protein
VEETFLSRSKRLKDLILLYLIEEMFIKKEPAIKRILSIIIFIAHIPIQFQWHEIKSPYVFFYSWYNVNER